MEGEEKRLEVAAAAVERAEAEEKKKFLEGVTVLDFDMLCSTVAMQAQKRNWVKLNSEEEHDDDSNFGGGGGGVLRMWEGELLHDCFDDRRIAIQSTCCPCYQFGKNMKRAGFGPCFLQGSVYFFISIIAFINMLTFVVTERRGFLYIFLAFTISAGVYLGFFRTQIRKKFNIRDSDSSFDDCAYHLICPCCTLCQESRTLEMNNVQDGIWHGRGDTICIGSYSEASSNQFFQRSPPPIMSAKAPEPCSMQDSNRS